MHPDLPETFCACFHPLGLVSWQTFRWRRMFQPLTVRQDQRSMSMKFTNLPMRHPKSDGDQLWMVGTLVWDELPHLHSLHFLRVGSTHSETGWHSPLEALILGLSDSVTLWQVYSVSYPLLLTSFVSLFCPWMSVPWMAYMPSQVGQGGLVTEKIKIRRDPLAVYR